LLMFFVSSVKYTIRTLPACPGAVPQLATALQAGSPVPHHDPGRGSDT